MCETCNDKMLSRRGLETANLCRGCDGWGVKTYGTTSTWHDAIISGQAMTDDVCDMCWGSGNADRPWPSHRFLKVKPDDQ